MALTSSLRSGSITANCRLLKPKLERDGGETTRAISARVKTSLAWSSRMRCVSSSSSQPTALKRGIHRDIKQRGLIQNETQVIANAAGCRQRRAVIWNTVRPDCWRVSFRSTETPHGRVFSRHTPQESGVEREEIVSYSQICCHSALLRLAFIFQHGELIWLRKGICRLSRPFASSCNGCQEEAWRPCPASLPNWSAVSFRLAKDITNQGIIQGRQFFRHHHQTHMRAEWRWRFHPATPSGDVRPTG